MLENMYFSQNSLSMFNLCPLKFRYRYIDGLYWPKLWDGRDSMRESVELGQKFHLLAQRYFEGIDPFVPDNEPHAEKLKIWLKELKKFLPINPEHTYLPEHELRMGSKDIKLLAKYDLVHITSNNRVIIYDWKTYRKAKKKTYLENHLQTRVYMYTFAAAGNIYVPGLTPRDITIVYWHPEHIQNGIAIPYDEVKHNSNEMFLNGLIRDICSRPYENFLTTQEEKVCVSCEYRPVCQGMQAELIDSELFDDYIDVEEIVELSF